MAAPVGPIGLLCIQRTLNRGRLHGLAVGLGAATADALYGLVAGLGLAWISAVGLTLSNPATILSFSAVFAALGLSGTQGGAPAAGLLVLAVFAGSTAWWLLLSSATGALRERLQPHLGKIHLASGALVCAFGAWALWSALLSLSG